MIDWRERWPEFSDWLDSKLRELTYVEDPDDENPYEENN